MENATAVGSEAKVTANNSIVLGKNANVGIGYSAPAFQLHLSTDAAAKPGSPSWTVASDSRLKKNITDFKDGLDLLKQIKPVWFQYNSQAGIETGDKKFVGIIAQEMQKIAPYTIGTFTHQDSLGNKTEYLDYDANAVTYILINSVKEQQQIIEQKNAELKEMNAQVADLSKRLEQLERIVASNTAKPLNGSAARIEPNANGVVLEQNVPNGFSRTSAIKYFIPQSVKEARVDVYAVSGMKVNSYPVKERGEGQLTISAGDFQNGVFLYDLVTDGKSNGVKKMVVQK
ncbi:MAG TPA: tail fiber domain-containing protein [Dyadobacter sp.]|nr:tail fiber domain-containing protein [Dyadobacter sp.]